MRLAFWTGLVALLLGSPVWAQQLAPTLNPNSLHIGGPSLGNDHGVATTDSAGTISSQMVAPTGGGAAISLGDLAAALNSAKAVAANAVPNTAVGQPGGVAAQAVPGYDIVLLLGQSNMDGRDTPDVAHYDFGDPRVYQWGGTSSDAHYQTILSGNEPMMQPEGVETNALGPANSFARGYVSTMPYGRRLLLVPLAWGGTSMVQAGNSNDTACGNVIACWAPSLTPGAGGVLFENAVAQGSAALAAAQAQFPGSAIVGMLKVQGENDDATPGSVYCSVDDTFIADMRARLGAPSAWIIEGQMLPEYIATGTGTIQAIDQCHQNMPARNTLAAFVPGDFGHVWLGDGLNIHYNASGQRIQGTRMAAAVARAKANILGTPPPSAAECCPRLGARQSDGSDRDDNAAGCPCDGLSH